MKESNFLVEQVYRSADEKERKANIQAILDRYLLARLTQGPRNPPAENASGQAREVSG